MQKIELFSRLNCVFHAYNYNCGVYLKNIYSIPRDLLDEYCVTSKGTKKGVRHHSYSCRNLSAQVSKNLTANLGTAGDLFFSEFLNDRNKCKAIIDTRWIQRYKWRDGKSTL